MGKILSIFSVPEAVIYLIGFRNLILREVATKRIPLSQMADFQLLLPISKQTQKFKTRTS